MITFKRFLENRQTLGTEKYTPFLSRRKRPSKDNFPFAPTEDMTNLKQSPLQVKCHTELTLAIQKMEEMLKKLRETGADVKWLDDIYYLVSNARDGVRLINSSRERDVERLSQIGKGM